MCIGVPLRVVHADEQIAECEGPEGRVRLDNMLVGAVPAGTWLLSHQGRALRTMTGDEAARTNAALDALALAMSGAGGNFDAFFADLVDREPPLPEHLKRNLP
jgi:hydrogenase expression/formation protein HypC